MTKENHHLLEVKAHAPPPTEPDIPPDSSLDTPNPKPPTSDLRPPTPDPRLQVSTFDSWKALPDAVFDAGMGGRAAAKRERKKILEVRDHASIHARPPPDPHPGRDRVGIGEGSGRDRHLPDPPARAPPARDHAHMLPPPDHRPNPRKINSTELSRCGCRPPHKRMLLDALRRPQGGGARASHLTPSPTN